MVLKVLAAIEKKMNCAVFCLRQWRSFKNFIIDDTDGFLKLADDLQKKKKNIFQEISIAHDHTITDV